MLLDLLKGNGMLSYFPGRKLLFCHHFKHNKSEWDV